MMTNAEVIKNMTNKELALFLLRGCYGICNPQRPTLAQLEDWLTWEDSINQDIGTLKTAKNVGTKSMVNGETVFICPTCGATISLFKKPHECPFCSQKLKWGDK